MDCSRENSTTARLPLVKCVELRDDTACVCRAADPTSVKGGCAGLYSGEKTHG